MLVLAIYMGYKTVYDDLVIVANTSSSINI